MNTETPSIAPQENQYVSRKERRQLERAQQQGNSGGRKKILRRLLIWGIGAGILLAIGWGIMKLANDVQLPSEDGTLAVPVGAADNSTGPAGAPIVLVEYSDFQCPACGAFHPLVKQLLAEPDAKDKIQFVYRHFPLSQIHPNAELAAKAAQAAGLQNKFWEMHDKLFTGQAKWSGQSNTGAKKTFIEYATDLKLNISTFSKDIDSDAVGDKVKSDYEGGVASNVNSTPTFFINGNRMGPVKSYEEFKQIILSK